jgi:hypothetical protein
MTADITLVQTTTMRVEVQNGRVARLMDVTDETRTLEGIDRPLRIGGLSVSPGRLSDGEYRGVVEALVELKGKRR